MTEITTSADPFDHRGSIAAYLDRLADGHETKGLGLTAATALRSAASSARAFLDVEPGEREIASALHHMVKRCCEALSPGTLVEEVLSEDRFASLVRVRVAAAWCAKQRFKWENERIGRHLRRERTTIGHALQRAEQLRAEDPAFRAATDRIARDVLRCEHCLTPLDNTI